MLPAILRPTLVVAISFLLAPVTAYAACSTPTGAAGDQIFNTTYSVMQYCNGSVWINMGGVATSVTAAGSTGAVQFNTGNVLDADSSYLAWDKTNHRLGIGTAAPATALDVSGTVTATLFAGSGASLTALSASNLATGTVGTARLGSGTADSTTFLRGDQTWVTVSAGASGSAGGDLSGTYPNPTVAKINGVALGSTTATAGALLIGSGTQWVSNAVTGDVTITSGGVTAIGSAKVTNGMLVGSIAYSKLSLTGAILNADLAGSIALSKLSTTGTANSSTYLRGDGAWTALSGTLSGLTDVTLTSPASNDVLRYNGSAWVNVAASTAMTTTTMQTNWPDAIMCNFSGVQPSVFYLSYTAGSGGTYRVIANTGGQYEIFYNSAGNYSSNGNAGTTDCVTNAWSISQLYAGGKAYNFIGTGAVTTFNVGTASAPGLAVTSDTDTGLWSAGANTLNFSTGGTSRMAIDSSGNVGIGTASPEGKLHIDKDTTTLTDENLYAIKIEDGTNDTGLLLGVSASGDHSIIQSFDPGTTWTTRPLSLMPNGGFVGIGTTSPNAPLSIASTGPVIVMKKSDAVASSNSVYGYISLQDSAGTEYGWMGDGSTTNNYVTLMGGSTHGLQLGAGGGVRATIDTSGNVGIGTASPTAMLDVNGFAKFGSAAYTYIYLRDDESTNGIKYIHANSDVVGFLNGSGGWMSYLNNSGSWNPLSDIRLKTNIKTLTNALDNVTKMRGVSFNWIDPVRGSGTNIGVISQEVEPVYPELVGTDSDGYKHVTYDRFGPILLEAIKELNAKLEKLVAKVETFLARLGDQKLAGRE